MGVDIQHLQALYSGTHDPWGFETSTYEQDKFVATRQSLSRSHYEAAFELGCGNGQLARHLVDICARYTGMDAVERPLAHARAALPSATFLQGFYPCALPTDTFDLLIFSEILYFLDPAALSGLASDVADRWPRAEVICVTWLGPSGHDLQGSDALSIFVEASHLHAFEPVRRTVDYRIDRGLPKVRA